MIKFLKPVKGKRCDRRIFLYVNFYLENGLVVDFMARCGKLMPEGSADINYTW